MNRQVSPIRFLNQPCCIISIQAILSVYFQEITHYSLGKQSFLSVKINKR